MLSPDPGMGRFMAHSTTHPKYLHSNSTSHVWAFGAIAELIDNALDAGASKFHIDLLPTSKLFAVKAEPGQRTKPKQEPFVMTFRDDGKGMTPLELHKMLSFGHCDKDKFVSENGQVMPIGHYGNGFKSGSMRLGKDALVFTKSAKTQSVGLLSQTFLKDTNAIEVLVPIVSWDNETGEAISVSYDQQTLAITPIHTSPKLTEAFKANVKVINKYSPFESTAALRVALDKIQGTGTHVVVYNLRKPEQTDDLCEFSLEDNSDVGIEHDIQLAKCMWDEVTVAAGHSLAPLYYSLREYTSILYLNPRMQIWIRGHKVQLRKLEYSLYKPRECTYRSKATDAEPVTVTLGFNKFSEKEHFGMMIYHRDRLIKCFLHVGYQLSPDSRGVGVIGVLNVNALQPTHNKQSFIMDNNYRLLVNNLKDQLAKYWSTVIGRRSLTQFWCKLARSRSRGKICVQCAKCMKWRLVKMSGDKIPELWECNMLDGCSCSDREELPPIEKLIKRSANQDPSDVERKLEEQVVKIEKRHKETLNKLRAIKAKELATATGFPIEKCTAALRVSSDNKDLAGELLFSNKPIPGFDFEMDDLEDEEEEEAAEVDYDGAATTAGRKRRGSSSRAQAAWRSGKRRRTSTGGLREVSASDGGSEEDLPTAADGVGGQLTEREKRLVERQRHKQRMLEERMLGHDSIDGSPDKEQDAAAIEDEQDGEYTAAPTTVRRRMKKKKKSKTNNNNKKKNKKPRSEANENGGGDRDEEDDDSYDGDNGDGDEGAGRENEDGAVARRPYGAGAYCERCEAAEAELKRKDEEVEALRRRVRDLEELCRRAATAASATAVQQPIVVKEEPEYEYIEFL